MARAGQSRNRKELPSGWQGDPRPGAIIIALSRGTSRSWIHNRVTKSWTSILTRDESLVSDNLLQHKSCVFFLKISSLKYNFPFQRWGMFGKIICSVLPKQLTQDLKFNNCGKRLIFKLIILYCSWIMLYISRPMAEKQSPSLYEFWQMHKSHKYHQDQDLKYFLYTRNFLNGSL